MAAKVLLSILDEDMCFDILRNIRWPDGITCLNCGSSHYRLDHEETPKMQYRCFQCGFWWTDFSGTIFERTRQPLSYWFMTLHWFYEEKSALWVSKELGLGRHTAERMYRLVRSDLYAKRIDDMLSGTVEADEIYISCGEKGKKQMKREPRKRGLKQRGRGTWETDRPPVIGITERESGEIRLEVCENATKEICMDVIEYHVCPGSVVNTDEWGGYNDLSLDGYEHRTVCHSAGEYARDDDGDGVCEVHVNTMEGIWSLLRQYIRNFRGVCKKNLHLYVNAFEFLFNLRRRTADGLQSMLSRILIPHANRT